jgi:hypothetical protein
MFTSRFALRVGILLFTTCSAYAQQTAFTYQGQLKSGGMPYSGSADFQFSLWDAATSPPGVQVGLTQVAMNVGVSNGLFTQLVDFGPLQFDGHARWLQLAVRAPSGSGNFTVLSPRQPITAAPYATSLAVPCEAISDNDSTNAFTIIQNGAAAAAGFFTISSTTSIATALLATHAGNGPAVAGVNNHAGLNNFGLLGAPAYGVVGNSTTLDGIGGFSGGAGKSGVYGETSSNGGYGVFGRNTSSGNFGFLGSGTYGVYGTTANATHSGGYFENVSSGAPGANAAAVTGVSTAGIGVYGSSTAAARFGVYGTSPAPTGLANSLVGAGVLGDSTTNDGVTGIAGSPGRSGVSGYAQHAGGGGVYGINLATNNYGVIGGFGYGVYGLSPNGGHGVAGYSTATTGQNSGVHGETSSPAGFGVYGTLPTQSGIPLPGTGAGVMGDSGSGDGVVGFSSALSGVYGLSSAPGGAGVYGSNWQSQNFGAIGTSGAGAYGIAVAAGGTGVFGQAFGASGTNFGVYGRSDSPAGYGGYFFGRGYFSENVGIGTEQPVGPLQVIGGTDASLSGGGNIVVGQIGGANVVFDNNEIMARNNGAAADLILNNGGGKIGIGRTPTTNKLEVEGNASKTAAGSWLANSDARIKTDVCTVEDAANTLDRVRLVSFRYTDDYRQTHPALEDRRYLNVIAQEFAQVFPQYVTGSGEFLPDGSEILQVDTYPLTIYAAAAVQELHKALEQKDEQVSGLSEQLAQLREETARQIAAMSARLERIERMASIASAPNR